ncbi:MAG: hypothetical protein Kow0010_25570 [Dehalococcoidia bacterium]
MSNRLTVVFDDAGLYRRLKVRAAERGVPVKRIVEDALRSYLGPDPDEVNVKPFDWDAFDRWMKEVGEINASLPPGGPTDLSDVKKHLYGYAGASDRRSEQAAEAREPYDAQ